jgi:signal transduction histidine kinase
MEKSNTEKWAGVFRQVETRDVSVRLERGEWCAVIAPRFSGKSTFARQLHKSLTQEHPAWKVVHARFGTEATLGRAWERVRNEFTGMCGSTDAAPSRPGIREDLTEWIGASTGDVCLLLDNLDELPDEVLRLLAGEFRRLRDDLPLQAIVARLHVVFFGAMKLHYLSAAELSPLSGIVQKIDLPDLNCEQAAEAFSQVASTEKLTDEARQALFEETAGHPYLVGIIAERVGGGEGTAAGIRVAAKQWGEHAVRLSEPLDPCFQDVIVYLERDHRAFDVVRRLQEKAEPPPAPFGKPDLALMSGAVTARGERFAFRGRMLERALDLYFDTLRKADYCCLHGVWEEARNYYSTVEGAIVRERRRQNVGPSKRALMDLYRGLEQYALHFRYLSEAEEFTAATGRYFFGADRTLLWRLPRNQTKVEAVASPDIYGPKHDTSDLAAAAARNHAAFTLRGNLGVVQGIGSDPERIRWALQLQYDDGLPEPWVRENLQHLEPTLYAILNQARRREADATRERRQQTFIHEIVLQLQQAKQVDKVFSLIVRGVTDRLGYESAQLSLVFPKEGLLRAVESSGAFESVKYITIRNLDGPDILARVIRGRNPRIVDDCATPDSDCDQEAIKTSGLKSQVVIPLLVDETAIGTLQVGSTERTKAFRDEDLAVLQLLADAAAIAIQVTGDRESLELALGAVGNAMVVVDSDDCVASLNDDYAALFGARIGERALLTRVSLTDSTPLVQVAFQRGRPLQTLRDVGGRQYIVTAAGRKDVFGRYGGGVEVIDTKSPLYGLTEALSQMLELSEEEKLGPAIVDCLCRHFRYARARLYRADTEGAHMASAWCAGMSDDVAQSFHGAEFRYTRAENELPGDGFECLRDGSPVIVVRQQFAEKGLPVQKVTYDSQHRRVLVLPDERLFYMRELEKEDVREWMDVPLGDIAGPIGKLSIDQKSREAEFGLEDLEMMGLFSRWASQAMIRVRDLQQTRRVALAADEFRLLGESAGLEAVVWHFLLHVTMKGGPDLNRAAVFLRRPRSEKIAGFLCHGATTGKEFAEACKEFEETYDVRPQGNRDALIDSLSAPRTRGQLSQSERQRIERFRTFAVREDQPGDPFSQALVQRKTVHVREAKSRLAAFYELLGWEPAPEAIICPLVFGGECEGLLYGDRAFLTPGVAHRDDKRALEGQAIHLAAAAQSARLAEQLRHQVLGLSHTTLAPMIAIKAMAEGLMNSTEGERRELLKLIVAESDRGADTLRRMLHLAKVSAGAFLLQVSSCDLCQLLRDRIAPYQTLLEAEGIQVFDECEPDRVDAEVDPPLLGSAFAELAANAFVALRMLRSSPQSRFLSVRCTVDDSERTWQVVFENSGPPIPVELRPRVFEQFASGTGGTGIGLFLVDRIVRLHGGTIRYEAAEHGSSRFLLTIPLAGVTKEDR